MKRPSAVSDSKSPYQQDNDPNSQQPENGRNASPGVTVGFNAPANAPQILTVDRPNPGLMLSPPLTNTPAPTFFNFPFPANIRGMALPPQRPAAPQPPIIPSVFVSNPPSITSRASYNLHAVPGPITNLRPIPVSTATADRHNGAPALQPATPGQTSSGAQASSRGVGEARLPEGEAVVSRAKQLIYDYNEWKKVYDEISGEEKMRFAVASIEASCERPEHLVRNRWTAMLHLVCKNVGVERLMANRWPNGQTLTSVLIRLHLHEMLGMVLQTETGKKSLLLADDRGLRPLDHAARFSDAAAAKLILQFDDEGGTLRMQRSQGLLPLHRAAIAGAVEVAGLLLSLRSGEQRLNAAVGGSVLPIHHAIGFGASAAVVKLLLADVALEQVTAVTNPDQRTPLMLAIVYRMPDVIKELLAIKNTLRMQLTIRNAKGQTALDMAKEIGDEEIIALIEAAMKELPATSTASGSAPTNTAAGIEAPCSTAASSQEGARNDPPIPLTPFLDVPPDDDDEEESSS